MWSFSKLLNADLFRAEQSHVFQGLKGRGGQLPTKYKLKREIAVVLNKREPGVYSIDGKRQLRPKNYSFLCSI